MSGKSLKVIKRLLLAISSVAWISTSSLAQPVEVKVSDLRDVSPGDWAYEALANLVDRYGCLVGYPNQTFRGNQALTRYEFAAGLNAYLQQLEKLVAASEVVIREDLTVIERLTAEFSAELATINSRVDNLEGRLAYLEDHQFSTTTKLSGDVIMALSQVFGKENAATGEDLDVQATLQYRARLILNSSFTGKDRLRLRLDSANFVFGRGGSNFTDFNFSSNTGGELRLRKAEYRFPVGDKAQVWVGATNMAFDDVADPIAPFAGPTLDGAISYFGAIAPIYLNSTGAGLGFSYNFSDAISLVGYYSAGNAEDPSSGNGIFGGQYLAGTQLSYMPTANTGVGLVYTHSYFPTDEVALLGFSGSALAEDPFDGNATSAHNVAIVGSWLVNDFFSIEGWGMYTKAKAQSGERRGDTADIWNWKISFAFPDLFREGNLGLLSVGNPPKAYTVQGGPDDDDVSWFVELFYVFRINDNISVSPGFWVVTSPEDGRDPLWVGTVRTSFSF